MRAAILITLAALAANAQDAQPERGVNFYSVQKEAELGASMAAEVRRDTTPIDSAVVRDFVNKIGARLSVQLQRAPFQYTFDVIADDPNSPTHEPAALPGGYIFVPGKLILAANDEAEFAGMLAHSMAHAYERHSTRAATRGGIADQSTIPLIFMGGWTGYGIRQAASIQIPIGLLQGQRVFETQADRLAVTTTSSAGYDPSAFVRYIGRVAATQPGTTAQVFANLPTPAERVASMQTAIQALPQQTYAAPDPDEFARIQAEVRRLMPVAEKPQLNRVAGVTLKKRVN
jgi:predicted Zn-dependent protease